MSKYFIPAIILLFSGACSMPDRSAKLMQSRIDSLQSKINSTYKPGLGEFMSSIQIHHAKLWFAGQAGNWNLSNFELKEIRESIEDIQIYCADRAEIVSLPMINPSLDSLDKAIRNKDTTQFNSSFNLLTISCNNCHRATKHEFNVIQTPRSVPFSNQSFQVPAK